MDRREFLGGAVRVRDPAGRTCTHSGVVGSTSLAGPDEVEVGGRLRVAAPTTTRRARRGCAALRGGWGQLKANRHFVVATAANRVPQVGGVGVGWPAPAGCRPQIERPARGRSGAAAPTCHSRRVHVRREASRTRAASSLAAALTRFCIARASERRIRLMCTCDPQGRVHIKRQVEACIVKGEYAALASSLTLRVS